VTFSSLTIVAKTMRRIKIYVKSIEIKYKGQVKALNARKNTIAAATGRKFLYGPKKFWIFSVIAP